ncbi:MAG: TonB family protein [Holophagales bacterium]|nr:TonB family protein [Holophagales bacterium]
MSRELQLLLHERAHIRVLRWPVGLCVSFGLHLAIGVGILISPNSTPEARQEKIRWITLPAAAGGVSGGSAPTEAGQTKGRQRRVEEVAPIPAPSAQPRQVVIETPKPTEVILEKPKPPAQLPKGINPDPASRGTAPAAAKGASPVQNAVPGAAGSGNGGGLGQGTGIPDLRPTKGIMGGTGILQEFIGVSDFPLWYAQQVQDAVTRNWIQMRGGEGRVQIYFRILKSGKIEAARIEISSGKPDLDDLALQAVKRTTLPRLPEDFESDSLGVRFWFNYGK